MKRSMKIIFLNLILSHLLLPVWTSSVRAHNPEKAMTQYAHAVWETKDGLPQNSVHAITRTRDGYLWLGTQEGLVRFDGVRFTVFDKRTVKEMKSNHVQALVEGRDGSLWIATTSGLLRRRGGEFSRYSTEQGLSHDFLTALWEDGDGALWIGSFGGGVSRFKDGRVTTYTTRQGLSSDFVWSICGGDDGSLWIGTNEGLNRFHQGRFTVYQARRDLPGKVVWTIIRASGGGFWIGTDGGLVRWHEGRQRSYATREGLSYPAVRALSEQEGVLWVGTEGGGLYRLANGRFSSFTSRDGLSNDFVISLYEDREGILWIGTYGGGLNQLKEGKVTTYTTREGLSHDMVRCIFQSRDGSLWLGTNGGGLNRLRDGRVTVYTRKEGLAGDVVMALAEGRDGSLWVGTNGGLTRLGRGRFTTYTTRNGLSHNSIRALHEDRRGNLWIGTRGGGLNRLADGKITAYRVEDGFPSDVVRAIYEAPDGSLWFATNDGLVHMVDGRFVTYTTSDGLSSNTLLAITGDADGTLWIGTYGGGLNRFKEGKFTRYTTAEGLYDDVIFQILDDQHGSLWLSCNKGIFRVRKKELHDFAMGKLARISFSLLTTADGMKSSECNGGSQPAGWRSRDGRLWFPTLKGAAVIDPINVTFNSLAPPVVIEDLIADGDAVDFRQAIRLPPGKDRVEIHYTGLSFLAPEKVMFRYRLEGFDERWIEAGSRRVAYYTNLPPGRYRFRVTACNNDGVWNPVGATIEFSLEPHFYQTGWFYGLLSLLVLSAGVGVHRLRVRHLAARERELALRVHERTLTLQREISERRQAEALVRATNQKLEALIQASPVAILALDLDGRVTMWNAAAERMFGWTEAEVLGKLLPIVPEEKMEEFTALRRRVVEEGGFTGVEIRRRRKDGTPIDLSLSTSPLRDAKGSISGIMAVIIDVTEQKRVQEELKKAREAAETACRAKSEFLANVSHEIRTPMNGIIGMTELLLETDLTADQREGLEIVRDSARTLLMILNDILDYSKIEAGKLVLDSVAFNLREILEATLKPFLAQAYSKGVRVTYTMAAGVPEEFIGDPLRLQQILANLLSNAVKFTPRGEIIVSVERVEKGAPTRDFSDGPVAEAGPAGCLLHFQVTDTGIGIAPEKQEVIFDAFTQADSSSTRKFGGTGLGLAICSRLVTAMGGRIWVESVPGQGSTFHFTVHLGVGPPAMSGASEAHCVSVAQNEIAQERSPRS